MPLYQCDLIRFGIAQLPARRCIPALGDTFLLLSLADSLLQGVERAKLSPGAK